MYGQEYYANNNVCYSWQPVQCTHICAHTSHFPGDVPVISMVLFLFLSGWIYLWYGHWICFMCIGCELICSVFMRKFIDGQWLLMRGSVASLVHFTGCFSVISKHVRFLKSVITWKCDIVLIVISCHLRYQSCLPLLFAVFPTLCHRFAYHPFPLSPTSP